MKEQFYTHYTNWEDYQNGMWAKPDSGQDQEQKSISVLLNPEHYMRLVVKEWPICTRQNLTDIKANRRSWLGQAACCISFKIPESVTRSVWFKITEEQRVNANLIAEKIIKEWEKDYSEQTF